MVSILVAGLKRYHELTADESVKDIIVNLMDWMIEKTYDEETGYFWYTTCRNRTVEPTLAIASMNLEALATMYSLPETSG